MHRVPEQPTEVSRLVRPAVCDVGIKLNVVKLIFTLDIFARNDCRPNPTALAIRQSAAAEVGVNRQEPVSGLSWTQTHQNNLEENQLLFMSTYQQVCFLLETPSSPVVGGFGRRLLSPLPALSLPVVQSTGPYWSPVTPDRWSAGSLKSKH